MTVPVPGPPRPADPRVPGRGPEEPSADVESTVRAAMAGLDGVQGRPLAEHVDAFERVHTVLGDALASGAE